MKKTQFIVSYQKAFGFSVRQEKTFSDLDKAQWFSRNLRNDNFIATILEVKE